MDLVVALLIKVTTALSLGYENEFILRLVWN